MQNAAPVRALEQTRSPEGETKSIIDVSFGRPFFRIRGTRKIKEIVKFLAHSTIFRNGIK